MSSFVALAFCLREYEPQIDLQAAPNVIHAPRPYSPHVIGYSELQLNDALMAHDWARAEALFHGKPVPPSMCRPKTRPGEVAKRDRSFPPPCTDASPGQVSVNCGCLGYPPLFYFAANGDLAVTQWLCDHGARVDVWYFCKSDFSGITVISAAVMSGNLSLLRFLLSRYRFTPFFLDLVRILTWHPTLNVVAVASLCKRYRMMELLVDHGAPVAFDVPLPCRTHWKLRRLLYIARLKWCTDSPFSLLPLDLIRLVDRYLCASIDPDMRNCTDYSSLDKWCSLVHFYPLPLSGAPDKRMSPTDRRLYYSKWQPTRTSSDC